MSEKSVSSLLIVDDSASDVFLADYFLRQTNRFRYIFSVNDGREALRLFAEYQRRRSDDPNRFPPIVILLDINMPVVGGFEFLDALQELIPEGEAPPNVVMLTSSDDAGDRARAFASPLVRDFIVKPPSIEDGRRIADEFGDVEDRWESPPGSSRSRDEAP